LRVRYKGIVIGRDNEQTPPSMHGIQQNNE